MMDSIKQVHWILAILGLSGISLNLSCTEKIEETPIIEFSVPEEYKCSDKPDTLCILILPTKEALDHTIYSNASPIADNVELEMWHRIRYDNEPFAENDDLSEIEKYARVSFYLRDRIEEDIDTVLINSGLDDLYFEVRVASTNWNWIATNEWVENDKKVFFEDYPTGKAIKVNADNFYKGLFEHTNLVQLQEAIRPDMVIVLTENYANKDFLIPNAQIFDNTTGGYLHGSWDPNAPTAGIDYPQERIALLYRKKIDRDIHSQGRDSFASLFGLMMGGRQDSLTDENCNEVSSYFYGENRCAHFEGINPNNPEQALEYPFRTILSKFITAPADADPQEDAALIANAARYAEVCPFGCFPVNVYSGNQSNSQAEYSTTTFLGVYPGELDISNNRCIIRKAWPYIADFSDTFRESDYSVLLDNPNTLSSVDLVNSCQ